MAIDPGQFNPYFRDMIKQLGDRERAKGRKPLEIAKVLRDKRDVLEAFTAGMRKFTLGDYIDFKGESGTTITKEMFKAFLKGRDDDLTRQELDDYEFLEEQWRSGGSTKSKPKLKEFKAPPKRPTSAARVVGRDKKLRDIADEVVFPVTEDDVENLAGIVNGAIQWDALPVEAFTTRNGELAALRFEYEADNGIHLTLMIHQGSERYKQWEKMVGGMGAAVFVVVISDPACPRQRLTVATPAQLHKQTMGDDFGPSRVIFFKDFGDALVALYNASLYLVNEDAATACRTLLANRTTPISGRGNPDRYVFHPGTGKLYKFPYRD